MNPTQADQLRQPVELQIGPARFRVAIRKNGKPFLEPRNTSIDTEIDVIITTSMLISKLAIAFVEIRGGGGVAEQNDEIHPDLCDFLGMSVGQCSL